jgi:hypothetical protein
MAHWISIEQGVYLIDSAYVFNPAHQAVALEDGVLEVYLDGDDERRVRGQAMMVNRSLVDLLEDHDELDLLLDLGEGFHYLVKDPVIRAGKVLAPDVKSLAYFAAQGPLEKLAASEYHRIKGRLAVIAPAH